MPPHPSFLTRLELCAYSCARLLDAPLDAPTLSPVSPPPPPHTHHLHTHTSSPADRFPFASLSRSHTQLSSSLPVFRPAHSRFQPSQPPRSLIFYSSRVLHQTRSRNCLSSILSYLWSSSQLSASLLSPTQPHRPLLIHRDSPKVNAAYASLHRAHLFALDPFSLF